ncbi:MAG: topoisomerase [Sphingomonas bacterium]|uniref:DNA topoisomerase IB n=1 Tax=Sphingomonas bacterium TaxID=1895847 RepID=UPI002617D757|nr:DNA topoisomerase IB [Sphingomonas bacterium]MDB5696639.1 topoisomerase [Sphingomonas bacterium]
MALKIVYSDDSKPGITRRRVRNGWAYFDSAGERIVDRDEIDRLNAIGLPPAYRDAWFNPRPHGHIQAVGWDEKGRKQYRYHPGYREQQEAAKYEKTAEFGRVLPKLRKRVAEDLARRALDKARAVAAVVRLLDIGHIRVGNEDYVKQNESYGATTLRTEHGEVKGNTLRLQFKAKSGKMCDKKVTDRGLARFVKACEDLDEQHLFAWVDDAGEAHPVTSSDVNLYIKTATGGDFTAKNFRTWGASLIAFEALIGADKDVTLKQLLEPVTQKLGNTPAIARKSYVHPDLIDLVKQDQAVFRRALRLPRAAGQLTREERGLIAFLERDVVPKAKAEAREAAAAA